MLFKGQLANFVQALLHENCVSHFGFIPVHSTHLVNVVLSLLLVLNLAFLCCSWFLYLLVVLLYLVI